MGFWVFLNMYWCLAQVFWKKWNHPGSLKKVIGSSDFLKRVWLSRDFHEFVQKMYGLSILSWFFVGSLARLGLFQLNELPLCLELFLKKSLHSGSTLNRPELNAMKCLLIIYLQPTNTTSKKLYSFYMKKIFYVY